MNIMAITETTQYIKFPLYNCVDTSFYVPLPHDHLPLFALGFTNSQLLLKQLHPLGQLLVSEAETVHLLLLLPQALVPLLQLLLMSKKERNERHMPGLTAEL